MTEPLPRIVSSRRSADQSFHASGEASAFCLGDFWAWSMSDLASNATRGVLAEYLVAQAIGAIHPTDVRTEWDSYDLETPDGQKVEVKSSAFVQSWAQSAYSRPAFSIRPARGWDADSGQTAPTATRSADLYVFALLSHRDQQTLDPTDVCQWEFFVVSTAELNERFGAQQTLSLSSLRAESESVSFSELRGAVKAAVSRGPKRG